MMDELKRVEKNNVTIPQYNDMSLGYQTALQVVDDVVLKNYITDLNKMEIVPLSKDIVESNIRDNVLFFKITEMVYEKEEFAPYKFASVFNSLSMTESSIFIIIDSDGDKTDFYMGVRSLDENRTTSSIKNTVENAMKGQFPGIKTEDYTIEEIEMIMQSIKANSISAVTCVANNKSDSSTTNQNFVQGLEKLVLSMQGVKYTGIILANGTTQQQLRTLRKGYENIYTQLSPFASTQVNYNQNSSMNFSHSDTKGSSESLSHTENKSKTVSTTSTSGVNTGHSVSSESAAGKCIKGITVASSLLGVALTPLIGGASLLAGGIVSSGLGVLGSAFSKTKSDSTSQSSSESSSHSSTDGTSDGVTNTVNKSISETQGYSQGLSEAMTLTLHDKSIENILERINKQLKRMDEFESLGMYECAAYFLSEDQYAAEVAASTYKAIMRGENSGVEIAAINSWGQMQQQKTQLISEYVKNFIHPVFRYAGAIGDIEVTPCSLVSGNELAIHMGLPRKSVRGLPVIEHADFGKEVVSYDNKKKEAGVNLGNIFNMGSICNNKVMLNKNSLSMHTFVTGSTGSGKSNTVYEMIRQLDNLGSNYLIIEPAKGEYKNVFGNSYGVHVFGTNPNYTKLLRINPFKFPKGIHILEHIDRLVEIFNVCWPMYAAMPAVLKDAIIQAYQTCGWDLAQSENQYSDELFPTFCDLLQELVDVIQKSSYSEEVKSNYIGSLVTRIKSLTNGLNGQIFTSNEVDNTVLFDEKVIVDISRIGSTETKSLIMGVLIMRLSEHRMSCIDGMNIPLKHVTVLEEAHNILKRTSTEQNPEGSNMAGKSVEMISNAIAEMRTYGEGFIIVDQSPSAVDISAIRNTNTKIIMRLPDEQDRRLAGKSAGLKDNQLDEIAKLPKGVAVVYQNDWIEPVLCKIQKYRGEEHPYHYIKEDSDIRKSQRTSILIKSLLDKAAGEKLDMNLKEITKIIINGDYSAKTKIEALRSIRLNYVEGLQDISSVIYDIVCTPEIEKLAEEVDSIDEWKDVFLHSGNEELLELSDQLQNQVVECILREQITRFDKPEEYLETWDEYLKGDVM